MPFTQEQIDPKFNQLPYTASIGTATETSVITNPFSADVDEQIQISGINTATVTTQAQLQLHNETVTLSKPY
jgi:hypothetical protein